MTSLEEIKPRSNPRLLDLIKAAGVDVSDWEQSARGASNPSYCYEWSFVQPDKVAVVTLWYAHLTEENGAIRGRPTPLQKLLHLKPVQIARAEKYAQALDLSWQKQLPVRVVISDGKMRDLKKVDAASSRVRVRMLDPVPWWVESYERSTGQYVLLRGQKPRRVIDQFTAEEQVSRREVVKQVPVRSASVRNAVLQQSCGLCEWCRLPGFETESGDVYLETHHVIPLSEGGLDTVSNVVALCPLHHREAHYGRRRGEMREMLRELLTIVRSLDAP